MLCSVSWSLILSCDIFPFICRPMIFKETSRMTAKLLCLLSLRTKALASLRAWNWMSWTLSTLKCSDQKDHQYMMGYLCPSSSPLVCTALHRAFGVWLALHCPPVERAAWTSCCFPEKTSLPGCCWAFPQFPGEDKPSPSMAVMQVVLHSKSKALI